MYHVASFESAHHGLLSAVPLVAHCFFSFFSRDVLLRFTSDAHPSRFTEGPEKGLFESLASHVSTQRALSLSRFLEKQQQQRVEPVYATNHVCEGHALSGHNLAT